MLKETIKCIMPKTSILIFVQIIFLEVTAQNTFPSSGNVGIGTSSPAELLHVNGRALFKGELYLDYSSGYSGINWINFHHSRESYIGQYFTGVYASNGDGQLTLSSAGPVRASFGTEWGVYSKGTFNGTTYPLTQRMFMNNSGNLSIGSHSPQYKLDVGGILAIRSGAGSEIKNANSIQIAANYSSPLAGRVIFGDNTGWNMNFASIDNTTNQIVDCFAFGDNGRLTTIGPNAGVWFNDRSANKSFIGYQGDITNHAVGIYASGGGGWAMTVLQNGNIGVANNTPTHKLDVNGNIYTNGKVLVGATDAGQYGGYAMAVNGTAIFNKVKVKLYGNWPDYVFNDDYKLPKLSYIESFIKQYKHLPGVPSATEVEKDGVDVGDMQATLLKKIEELTLYMIELDKKVESLKKENEMLKEKTFQK